MHRLQELEGMKSDLQSYKNLKIEAPQVVSEAERTAYSTQIKQLQTKIIESEENLKIKNKQNNDLKESNALLIKERDKYQNLFNEFKTKMQ